MTYSLEFSSQSEKQFLKLDKTISKQIFKKIQELKSNPFLGKPLMHKLKNQRSIHAGKYRVIYTIESKTIIIVKIKHRKNVYE
jgi:addiction module RelE/StbE family toxin